MSPFSQLNTRLGYGGDIDRDFSPALNYLDELDRHFSSHHRFVNCFIPRFDLEEDAHFYYLYGDIPGAKVEDINVEVYDNHTLVIDGVVERSSLAFPQGQNGGQQYYQEQQQQNGQKYEQGNQQYLPPPPGSPTQKSENENSKKSTTNILISDIEQQSQPQATTYFPPPQSPIAANLKYHTNNRRHSTYQNQSPNERRILLSQRLRGRFHRTFAFPGAVNENGVAATMENGVLELRVPKIISGDGRMGKRIPVVSRGFKRKSEGDVDE